MNYTTLCASIQDYVENSFSASQLAIFVEQAEQRIYNTVQLPDLRKNVTGATTASNKYLACPNDFLSTYSLAIINTDGTYTYLLNKDVNFIRESYPNPNITGTPKYYALFGPTVVTSVITDELSFILGPTPDDAYDVELHYFYYPESITTAGTSWLGDNYSPVLLYGTMLEAYVFLKGETDMMAVYKAKYDEAMMQLNRLGSGLERGDAYRDGQYRIAKVGP